MARIVTLSLRVVRASVRTPNYLKDILMLEMIVFEAERTTRVETFEAGKGTVLKTSALAHPT